MNKINAKINIKAKTELDIADEFAENINLKDLRLILKQSTGEIEKDIRGKDTYEALDEIELEVFGGVL